MEIQELKKNINREITALRQDLQDLKRCQLQYFTLTLAGTGAILGAATIFQGSMKGLALLAPLSIILPNWVIFFDKATTITRNVGYQRVLEEQLCKDDQIYKYLGFENALSYFRFNEKKAWDKIKYDVKKKIDYNTYEVFLLKTRHRFWMINWYTFAILSLICCGGSYTLLSTNMETIFLLNVSISAPVRTLWVGTASVFIGICAIYTLGIIFSLTRGSLSYEACKGKWEHILSNDRAFVAETEGEKESNFD